MPATRESTQSRQETELQRERDYYRAEEATDIAERLGYAMDHTMTHHIIDGHIYDDKMIRIADYTRQSLDEAPGKFFGPNVFEVERQRIEHTRTLQIEALARGELDGNALIEYSPIPDEVRDGTATLRGYRRDLGRDMVRIHYRDGAEMKCRLFSLDQTNPVSRQKVGDFLGINMPPDRSDRSILADRVVCTLTADEVDQLAEMTKSIHDSVLNEGGGMSVSAGSRFKHEDDALSIVYQHGDLLEEHMTHWSRLVGLGRSRSLGNADMEDFRQKTAAAIDLRLGGVSVASLSEGGVAEHAGNGDFDAYCPTGATTSEQMGMGVGKEGDMKCVTCPICGTKGVDGIVSSGTIVCSKNKCTVDRRTGKVLRGPRGVQRASDDKPESKSFEKRKNLNRPDVKRAFGAHAEEQVRYTIGGAERVIYDRSADRVLARVTNKGFAPPV